VLLPVEIPPVIPIAGIYMANLNAVEAAVSAANFEKTNAATQNVIPRYW
jgi:hypothetical protein